MRQIFLMMIGLSVSLVAGLSKSGDIVTDSQTRLQWQDDATPATMSWQAAIDYCEALSLDGYSDWRLPNIRELISIMDDTKRNPSINNSVFINTVSDDYWSSSTVVGNENFAWNVRFYYGNDFWSNKSSSNYVRCVRVGQ